MSAALEPDPPEPSHAGHEPYRLARVAWWWRVRVGWVGSISLALMLSAWACHRWLGPSIDRQAEAEQARGVKATEAIGVQHASVGSVDARAVWRDEMTPWPQRFRTIGVFLRAAKSAGVNVERVGYETDSPVAGIVRLKVSMQASGGYERQRRFLAQALNTLPYVGLERIELEPSSTDGNLSGRSTWSFLFKED